MIIKFMLKLLFIFFCLLIFSACNVKVEEYDQINTNNLDTVTIERIKIETH